jgi:transposase
MKQDGEIKLLLNERRKGTKQKVAAARSGMSERTARKYEHAGKLPSELNKPRTHRTRSNPFEQDWPWFVSELKRDPALQAKTLFVLINQLYPGRYQEGQLRTLQRQISVWRIQHGPEQEIMFAQEHIPGRMAQSDFTEMNSLAITLGGQPFPHLVFHLVLTYSNTEAIKVCFSESFASLSEGVEECLSKIGGAPMYHRTDNLSAAVSGLDDEGRHEFTKNYQALLNHYGMKPSANKAGCANQNGDVEQSHFRFKSAVDQGLRVRGSRDFSSRIVYESFLEAIVRNRNLTRTTRFEQERQVLQALPVKALCLAREVTVRVSRFSLIRVDNNTYSVPSKLIGAEIKVRIHAETLDLYHVATQLLSLPRLVGSNKRRIDYRHLIWSLVRKPGAFANYCYREELFPTTVFRRAYDALVDATPTKADSAYLRILHLAASTVESDVQLAITILLDDKKTPTFEAVRELVAEVKPAQPPAINKTPIDLRRYDALIASRGQHG